MADEAKQRAAAALDVLRGRGERQLALTKERQDAIGGVEEIAAAEARARVAVSEPEDLELRGDLPAVLRDADAVDHGLPDVIERLRRHAARSESSE